MFEIRNRPKIGRSGLRISRQLLWSEIQNSPIVQNSDPFQCYKSLEEAISVRISDNWSSRFQTSEIWTVRQLDATQMFEIQIWDSGCTWKNDGRFRFLPDLFDSSPFFIFRRIGFFFLDLDFETLKAGSPSSLASSPETGLEWIVWYKK